MNQLNYFHAKVRTKNISEAYNYHLNNTLNTKPTFLKLLLYRLIKEETRTRLHYYIISDGLMPVERKYLLFVDRIEWR